MFKKLSLGIAVSTIATIAAADPAQQVTLKGQTFTVDASELCGYGGGSIAGHRIHAFASGDVWIGDRWGQKVVFDDVCPRTIRRSSGGGGGFRDEWSGSDLVDDDGNVNIGANEDKTDHGDGAPPSIDS